MNTTVNVNNLRPKIRYTFIHKSGDVFRGNLDIYQSANGVSRQAIRLINVDGLHGALCMPISNIKMVKVYALPNNIPSFPYLIPEVSMIINQYI